MGRKSDHSYDRQHMKQLAAKLAAQKMPRLNNAEIGRRLGVSRNTVVGLIRSARRKSKFAESNPYPS